MTGPEEDAINTQQPSQQPDNDPVFSIAAAPGGEAIFVGRASGLYRSLDGGATWLPLLESLGISGPSPVVTVEVSPSFSLDRTVLAGVPGAALRSTDGGVSWRMLPFRPPAPYLTALAFSPDYLHDGVILAGTAEDGILRSANGGEDWNSWNFGLLDLEVLCLGISPAFEQDETVFAGTSSGLFRSTNGGRAWKEMKLPCGHVPVLSLSTLLQAGSHLRIFAGTEGNGLFASEDHGKNWSPIGGSRLEGPVNAILASDEEGGLLLGALVDRSLFVSTDNADTWNQVRLPGGNKRISTVFSPSRFGLDRQLFMGLETGDVIRLERLSETL